uniref:Putative secreted protein n=1 Tax=Rhipicephalus microplus TaxID=6941 RepID=A0A6G5A7P5_RHIMP
MVGQKLSLLLILALVAVVIAKPSKRELDLEAREAVASTGSSESDEDQVGNQDGPPALPRLSPTGSSGGFEAIPTEDSRK